MGEIRVDGGHRVDRTEARLSVSIAGAKFRESGAKGAGVVIEDLSRQGFRTEWPFELKPGDTVWLTLPGIAPKGAIVRWSRRYQIGYKFEEPLHAAVFAHLLKRLKAR